MNRNATTYGFLLYFAALAYFGSSKAMTAAPYFQRACLDLNGLVTVYFVPPSDPCGSFVSYELWGREDAISPFSRLTTTTSQTATQMQSSLPNKKKWSFYIAALYGCNGSDTLYSDTIFIDDTPPALLDPDSVSVDLLTQRVVAGWQKAPEPDAKGYSLFKVDLSTGNNLLIDQKDVLFYSFNTSDFDSKQSNNRFLLAVYDSCDNGGVISNYHSPVLLAFNSGQNVDYQCTKKLYIQWTAYIGWVVSSYDIYVIDSSTGAWSVVANVPSSQLNYTFDIPSLGRKYGFFIRAHKAASTITSSSNFITFDARDFATPAYKFIGHVSVVSDGVIEITGLWEPLSSIPSVMLQYKNYGTSTWTTLSSYAGSKGTIGRYKHGSRSTSSAKYEYRLLFQNSCNAPIDSTAIHTSMLLRRNGFLFFWNEYWAWESTSHETDLYNKEKQSSTWKQLFVDPDSELIVIDTLTPTCYRVTAYRLGVNNKPVDTAYSNILCLNAVDTTLIPGAFSPGGQNPVFQIYNPNLLPGQAILKIYDRWGARIFEGDALVGWDGTDRDGKYILGGFYVYLVEVRTPEKIETFKGTVMVLR